MQAVNGANPLEGTICKTPILFGREDCYGGSGLTGLLVDNGWPHKEVLAHVAAMLMEPISIGEWKRADGGPPGFRFPEELPFASLAHQLGVDELRLQVIYFTQGGNSDDGFAVKRGLQLWSPDPEAKKSIEAVYADKELCDALEAFATAVGWPETLTGRLAVLSLTCYGAGFMEQAPSSSQPPAG